MRLLPSEVTRFSSGKLYLFVLYVASKRIASGDRCSRARFPGWIQQRVTIELSSATSFLDKISAGAKIFHRLRVSQLEARISAKSDLEKFHGFAHSPIPVLLLL